MKSLDVPSHDDEATLKDLSENRKLCSYPHLQHAMLTIQNQYSNYTSVRGDPWNVLPLALSDSLRKAIVGHYESPPKALRHLQKLRHESSPDVCPMCGSLGTGTLDHVLPKANYPELSIFTKNLVPACGCNSLRSVSFKGSSLGQRVLHPYYDTCMNQ